MSAEWLRDAARRVRRHPAWRARRPARARQPARPRHPARHALRARPLRQLPSRAPARRSALPAEGPRPRTTSTSSSSARTPKGVYVGVGGRFKAGTHRRNRGAGRNQHLQGRQSHHPPRVRVRARRTACRRVCMADKSNAMTHGHALWQRVFEEVAAEYPGDSAHAPVHRRARDVPDQGSRSVRGHRHQQPVRRHRHRHRRRAAGRPRHGGVGQHSSRPDVAVRAGARIGAAAGRARTSPTRSARFCRRR